MSCQDVCMTADYDGSTEFYSESIRRAAKGHKCCECGDPILIGMKYEYISGKFDGDFATFHTCLACAEIRGAYYCNGFMIGCVRDDMCEQMFPHWNEMTAIDCLAKLESPAAIAKVREWFGDWHDGGLPDWMLKPAQPQLGDPK